MENLQPLYSTTQEVGITGYISKKEAPMLRKIFWDNDECESCSKSRTNPDGESIRDHSAAKDVDSFIDPCNVVPYNFLDT